MLSAIRYRRRFLVQTYYFQTENLKFNCLQMSKMSTRVYVGGLNHRSREKDVERFFRKFGLIREISIKVNTARNNAT